MTKLICRCYAAAQRNRCTTQSFDIFMEEKGFLKKNPKPQQTTRTFY